MVKASLASHYKEKLRPIKLNKIMKHEKAACF